MIAREDGLPRGTSLSQSYVLESTTTLFMAVSQQNQAGHGAPGGEMLHRLVGWTIFSVTHGVMREEQESLPQ
jgi:hypothetical protein